MLRRARHNDRKVAPGNIGRFALGNTGTVLDLERYAVAMLHTDDQSRISTQTLPRCVYCDRPMRPVLTDKLDPAEVFTQFTCQGCGWEVVVPFE